MRYDKTRKILELARALASSAEGLTLDDMCRTTGCKRRTVERIGDTIREVFPQMEEIADRPTKRFRIPKGLDGFFQDPTAEELSDLGVGVAELRDTGATARAGSLAKLERKIRAAMRHGRRRATETDVAALLRAERIAVQAGPRPAEDPAVLMNRLNARGLCARRCQAFAQGQGRVRASTRDLRRIAGSAVWHSCPGRHDPCRGRRSGNVRSPPHPLHSQAAHARLRALCCR
jgi:hypothetical protein